MDRGAAGGVGGGQEVTRGGEVGRFVRWTFLTMGALLFGVFAVITGYDIYTGLRGDCLNTGRAELLGLAGLVALMWRPRAS